MTATRAACRSPSRRWRTGYLQQGGRRVRMGSGMVRRVLRALAVPITAHSYTATAGSGHDQLGLHPDMPGLRPFLRVLQCLQRLLHAPRRCGPRLPRRPRARHQRDRCACQPMSDSLSFDLSLSWSIIVFHMKRPTKRRCCFCRALLHGNCHSQRHRVARGLVRPEQYPIDFCLPRP